MSPQNNVEKFLWEDYGYGRIDGALRYLGQQRGGLFLSDIGKFFEGTLLGTYKGCQANENIKREYARGLKTLPYPPIAKIRTTEEALKELAEHNKIMFRVHDLPYHLFNWGFLHGQERDQVERYVERLKGEMFPLGRTHPKKGEKKSETWEFQLLLPELFSFYVTGSAASNTKEIIVDFCAESRLKDEINSLVSEYYKKLNPLKLKL
jgi:hypothetical protein